MPELDKTRIRDRLRVDNVWIGTTRTPLFDAVEEQKIRYVVAIHLNGDTSAQRQVDIEKLEEDGSYTLKFGDVPVGANQHQELPGSGYSIEDPIIGLEGGTRLYGTAVGNSLNGSIIYWDSPEL